MASVTQQLSLFGNSAEPLSYKRCLRCLEVKNYSNFGLDNSSRDKKYRYCRSCAWPNKGIYLRGRGDDGTSKICAKCKERKSYDNFFKSKATIDGLHSYCKLCVKQDRKKREERQKEENPDLVKENSRQKYLRTKKKRALEPEKYKEQLRGTYKRTKARCEADPEYAARRREYRRVNANKRFARLYSTEEGRAHILSIWHRRRARIKANGGSYTQEEWTRLCEYFQNKCVRCGSSEKLSVDHVKPLVMGGANDISNIQPLCLPCNVRKNARYVDYRKDLGFLCQEMSQQT